MDSLSFILIEATQTRLWRVLYFFNTCIQYMHVQAARPQ